MRRLLPCAATAATEVIAKLLVTCQVADHDVECLLPRRIDWPSRRCGPVARMVTDRATNQPGGIETQLVDSTSPSVSSRSHLWYVPLEVRRHGQGEFHRYPLQRCCRAIARPLAML